jgi:hypothetical protein
MAVNVRHEARSPAEASPAPPVERVAAVSAAGKRPALCAGDSAAEGEECCCLCSVCMCYEHARGHLRQQF